MITKRTVLVLGAGASMPYGFPSGEGLVSDILNGRTQHATSITKVGLDTWFRRLDFPENLIKSFQMDLAHSAVFSIDSFLEGRPEYLEIGKCAIAATLMQYEDEYELHTRVIDDQSARRRSMRWYPWLLNALDCQSSRLDPSKLTVVNFNYDRSLLKFLLDAVQARYNMKLPEAVSCVSNMNIIHVHGALGNLQELGESIANPYGCELTVQSIRNAAGGIKVWHEGEKHFGLFAKASEAILSADRVYFLGFGFHDANMKRLGRDSWSGQQEGKFWATCYGLERGEMKQAGVRFGKAKVNFGLRPSDVDTKADVLLFLRRWADFV